MSWVAIRGRRLSKRPTYHRIRREGPQSIRLVLVVGLVLATMVSALPAMADKDCSSTSTGLIPLTDLGSDSYLGHQGGLYPDGSNVLPAGHLQLGLALGSEVVPRDRTGEPSADGQIGFLSIGVSNTRLEFSRFQEVAAADDNVSPALVFVNGAQGSRPLEDWVGGSGTPTWRTLDDDLGHAGLSDEQVQVVWIKLPSSERGTVDLESTGPEIDQLVTVLQQLSDKFPNLRLAYFSSRIYGGYGLDSRGSSRSAPAPEPKAYQNGFAVKWLVEQQLDGDPRLNADPSIGPVESPWVAWGPYLWADGLTPRSDGLVWECEDIQDDGIHPSASGADKVARLLVDHLSADPTAAGWFLGESVQQPTSTVTTPTTGGDSSTSTSQPVDGTTSSTSVPSEPDAPASTNTWVLVAIAMLTLIVVGVTVLRVVARRNSR